MAEFDYSLRVSLDKALPPVSSDLVDVDFCATDANQTPPTLRFSVASFGTASVAGVHSDCRTVGTSSITMLTTSQFGTAVSRSWVLLRETGNHTAASIRVVAFDVDAAQSAPCAVIKNRELAFFRVRPGVGYQVRSDTTNTTGTIEIIALGE
jgi:hypothetical protein